MKDFIILFILIAIVAAVFFGVFLLYKTECHKSADVYGFNWKYDVWAGCLITPDGKTWVRLEDWFVIGK